MGQKRCSVDPFSRAGRVDFFEGEAGALVKDGLGLKAQVFVVSVGSHASLERTEVYRAEFGEDVLAGRAFIFTSEADES